MLRLAKVKRRKVGNVTILDLTGEITRGNSVLALRQAFTEIDHESEGGNGDILLNLKDAGRIDNAGLMEFHYGRGKAEKRGGDFKICALNGEAVGDPMIVLALEQAFDIYETEAAALASN